MELCNHESITLAGRCTHQSQAVKYFAILFERRDWRCEFCLFPFAPVHWNHLEQFMSGIVI